EPSTVTVPAGDRLVIELTNDDDTTVHDLYLTDGADSGRVDPGGSVTVAAGGVRRSLDRWRPLAGHKGMGMTFRVLGEGGDPAAAHDAHGGAGGAAATAPTEAIDVLAPPSGDVVTRDPALAPAPAGREHRIALTVEETTDERAPGVVRPVWTYNGGLPAPTLRGRVGDTFIVTFRNEGTIGHSIDFHA